MFRYGRPLSSWARLGKEMSSRPPRVLSDQDGGWVNLRFVLGRLADGCGGGSHGRSWARLKILLSFFILFLACRWL